MFPLSRNGREHTRLYINSRATNWFTVVALGIMSDVNSNTNRNFIFSPSCQLFAVGAEANRDMPRSISTSSCDALQLPVVHFVFDIPFAERIFFMVSPSAFSYMLYGTTIPEARLYLTMTICIRLAYSAISCTRVQMLPSSRHSKSYIDLPVRIIEERPSLSYGLNIFLTVFMSLSFYGYYTMCFIFTDS